MDILTIDLPLIRERFAELAALICENWEGADEPSPVLLTKATLQLFETLALHESTGHQADMPAPLKPRELDELGDYGLTLLQEMSAFAADLGLKEVAEDMEDLCLPFALWMGRHNIEIKTLEPIVNTLARMANHIAETDILSALFVHTTEIIEAVAPQISQDLEQTNPMRPWRILLFNYAIMATRSHDTEIMRIAFNLLVEKLPADAPRFFEEGIGQMDLLNYPSHVKELMQQYYLLHKSGHTLH